MKNSKRFWIGLVALCAITSLALALAIIAVSATAAAFASAENRDAAPVQQAGNSEKVFVGMVADSRCGARHNPALGKSPAECVRACVAHGAKYVLVDGDKVYALDGNTGDVEKFAGQRVKVSGTPNRNLVQVRLVDAAQ